MQIGDRVLYTQNGEIDFARDLGTIVDFEEILHDPVVRFDDGYQGPIPKEDLMRVVTRQESLANHGYFGCLTDPCPVHSTKENEGESG